MALASINDANVFCTLFLIFSLVKPSALLLKKVIIIFIFIRSSDFLEIQGVLVLNKNLELFTGFFPKLSLIHASF